VVARNAGQIANVGPQLLAALLLLHGGGFALGYLASRALGLSERKARTNSIEVGMQNSTLGAVLAATHIGPLAAVPCALSAITHSLLGSLLAGFWRARDSARAAEEGDGSTTYRFA